MFAIIVILSNILIGQLSYRYAAAIEAAEIRYGIDKTMYITKLENSRFKFMVCPIIIFWRYNVLQKVLLLEELAMMEQLAMKCKKH